MQLRVKENRSDWEILDYSNYNGSYHGNWNSMCYTCSDRPGSSHTSSKRAARCLKDLAAVKISFFFSEFSALVWFHNAPEIKRISVIKLISLALCNSKHIFKAYI